MSEPNIDKDLEEIIWHITDQVENLGNRHPGILKEALSDIKALILKSLPKELVGIRRTDNISIAQAYLDGYDDCLSEIRSIYE